VGAPKLEYPGQLPRLSLPEKHFLTQLLSDVPKDAVSYQSFKKSLLKEFNLRFSRKQLHRLSIQIWGVFKQILTFQRLNCCWQKNSLNCHRLAKLEFL
jgi:hypothetical protein